MIEKKKKKRQLTHATQRSLKLMRENGWQAWIVEKWIPPRGKMKFGVRQDVWGFGDILMCRPVIYTTCVICFGQGKIPPFSHPITCRTCNGVGRVKVGDRMVALVQCFAATGGRRFEEHREKVKAIPEHETWLAAGGKIFLQGWAKRGPRGEKKQWTMKEEEL